MSPRREDISNAIWSDPDFEELSLDATTLYLWSFTNPRCGMAGIYKVSRRAMTESKVPADRLDDALTELAAHRFAFYEDGVLWIRTRVKHLRQKTVQIAKSIASDLRQIAPAHPLRAAFIDEYGTEVWLREHLPSDPLVTLTRPSGEGHQTPDESSDSLTLTSPSGEGHVTLQGKGKGKVVVEKNGEVARARKAADQLPADFPDALQPVLADVVPVLARVAEIKSAAAVTPAAVARAMMTFPRRDHRKAAGDMEHWLIYGTGQNRAVKDVVATFRNQLDRLPDLQTVGAAAPAGSRLDDADYRRKVLGE